MAELHIEANACLSVKKELQVQRTRTQWRQEVDANGDHEDINITEEKGNVTFVFASLTPS